MHMPRRPLRQVAVGSSLFYALAVASCKETSPSSRGNVTARKSPSSSFYAADAAELQQNSDLYFKVWNSTFSLHLADLPLAGEVPDAKKPMTGSYYAELDGGTDQVMVGGISPLQKYDNAFYNGNNTSRAWERANHTSQVSWAGHCNGFAAAGQRHPTEPHAQVTRNGVTFAPQDIKALMAEIHMTADYQFLGGTRCSQAAPDGPETRSDPTVMDACQGMNPGTLHAAVSNWVGKMQHVIIMDLYAGDQVWNHPVIKYQILSTTYVTAQQAAQAVVANDKTYVFNPAAVKFAQVHANIVTVNTSRQEVLGVRDPTNNDLQYILELDANGDIVGGEWIGASIKKHPNFIWVAFAPLTPNGTRYDGNQYIDAATVLSMYAESIGQDPSHPQDDVQRPPSASSWGQMNGFKVVLDGLNTGAAFAGKPLLLHVARQAQGALDGGGLELNLSLNGGAATTITSTGSEVFDIPVTAGAGLNRFEFAWKKNGTIVDDEFLRFRVVR